MQTTATTRGRRGPRRVTLSVRGLEARRRAIRRLDLASDELERSDAEPRHQVAFDQPGVASVVGPHGRPQRAGAWADRGTAVAAVSVFPRLRLREDRQLVTYRYRGASDGSGWTFSFPDHVTPPDAEAFFGGGGSPAESPDGADPDAMAAVAGDGTLQSYLQAALLGLELADLGSRWPSLEWSTHELVDYDDVPEEMLYPDPSGFWTWLAVPPGSWRPEAVLGADGLVRVRFWTASGLGQWQMLEHRCTFDRRRSLVPIGACSTTIATAEGGYLF